MDKPFMIYQNAHNLYTLNDDDQRISAGSWAYQYDEQGQLTDASALSYTYDGAGNRSNYTVNDLNQYPEIGSYDADGNLLSYDGWTYTWNIENRLTQAGKDNMLVEFAYDYMGRRIEKKVTISDVVTKHEKYVYDEYKLIGIYNGLANDLWQTSFTWQPTESGGADIPLSMHYATTIGYYVADANKNILGLYDADGNQTAAYTYDPFGNLLSSSGTWANANPFRFSSEFHDDETGLVYYNFRYYNPQIGRWLSRDPLGEQGGVNLYAMVGNNPINLWDILGLGIFTIQKVSIDTNQPGMSIEALKASSKGFSVSWRPSKNDISKCKCGKIYLSQAISSWSLAGRVSHFDATREEIKNQKQSGNTNPPPTMNVKGDTKYSYIDSPSTISSYSLTAAAICVPDKDKSKWSVLDVATFSLGSGEKRIISLPSGTTIVSEGEKVSFPGKDPNIHWKNAEKDWKNK
jgi:RHS repeat-associated protein